MEALGIEFLGEFDDFLGRETGRAEGIFPADFVVFPIAGRCGLHASVFAEHGHSRKHVLWLALCYRAGGNEREMTDLNLIRRLTTILAIDVVAFSTMSA